MTGYCTRLFSHFVVVNDRLFLFKNRYCVTLFGVKFYFAAILSLMLCIQMFVKLVNVFF